MINHKRIFNGGLNADSDFELVEANQWVNASNIRTFSTDAGANNIIESVGGNSLLFSALPTGINYCIGGCEDEENGWLVWFNYNAGGEHGIYCYSKALNVTYTVLLTSQTAGALDLSKNRYIHSCGVVKGILYWADITAKKINLKAAINLNHPNTFTNIAYSTPVDNKILSLLKSPPLNAPTFTFSPAPPALNYNFIENKVFRFASRFNYYDNEISVLSAFSTVADLRQKFNTTVSSFYVTLITPIPQEVRSIDIVVQFVETGKCYIVNTYSKDVPTDAGAIAANTLSYIFKNDVLGEFLDDPYVAKSEENIPIETGTLVLAKNRLFLGNNKVGYNSPKTTSLTFVSLQTTNIGSLGNYAPQQIFKTDTFYDIGIEFYDAFLRRTGVVNGPNVYSGDATFSTSYNETTENPTIIPRTTGINLSLSNTNAVTEIPQEAFYYRIVRGQASTTSNFLQGKTVNMEYLYKDPVTGLYAQSTSSTGINPTDGVFPLGIAVNIQDLITNKLGYGFTEGSGDVFKTYLNSGQKFNGQVVGVKGNELYVTLAPALIGTVITWNAQTSNKDAMFEIYSPNKNAATKIYYQTGYDFFAINNPGTNTRQYAQLSMTLSPDVWMVKRNVTTQGRGYLEAMSPNDEYWQNWYRSETRPNIIDTIGQKKIGGQILFSNVLIPGTKVNGLSSFEALNETILDQENGAISKLELTSKIQEDGTVMLAICTQETVSCYLGEQELFDTSGSQFVARANNVIGNTKALSGSMGTTNPESVVVNNGLVWWWDIRNGCAAQYSGNGLFPISKNKFTRPANLFSKKFNSLTATAIETLQSRPYIIGGFDPHHKELLFTIPTTSATPPKGNLADYTSPAITYPYDIYDEKGKTLIYKSEADRFIGSMSFESEKFLRLGNDLYGFKNGALYIFNQATPANFFGTQYTAKIMYANNPKGINTFLTLGLEANKKPLFVHLRTEDPYIQSTDLVANDFTTKEGVQYAPLFRDRLSPNTTGTYLAKQMTGDKLFGKALLTMLEFTVANGHLQLRFSNVGHIKNEGHNI